MATTSPDNIRTPNPTDNFNLVADWATTASDVQDALTRRANAYKGTASQRDSLTSTAANGTLWQDTDGVKMIWRKDGAVWVPAVWRWAGTTAQMNAFAAPDGFEWFNSTNNIEYNRLGGAWVSDDTGWLNLTNIRGGLAASSTPPQVRRYKGMFMVRGSFTGSGFSGGYTAVATIPAACIPSVNVEISAPANTAAVTAMQARTDGNFYAYRSAASGAWFNPSGVYGG